MTSLIITNEEKSGIRVTNARLQPLLTWLHFLNFITITILCLLALKIYKTLILLYKWLFPFKHISEYPIILVLGPKDQLIQQITIQLSQIYNAEIVTYEDLNGNSHKNLKPNAKNQKSHIICSHEEISSQEVISTLKTNVQNAYGFVDILVISQNEDYPKNKSTHYFLNHLNKELLVQFWTVMAFLPDMLRRNKGHILSVALGRTSLTNTGIMRTIHEEILQCDTNVKLSLVGRNPFLDNYYFPSLSSDVLANLILRSMWNSNSMVKVPSLSCYLIMLPLYVLFRLLGRLLLKPMASIIKLISGRNSYLRNH